MQLSSRKNVVLILCAIAFLVAAPLGAKASVTVNQQIPSSGGFVDSCTGDFVVASFNVHVVASITNDSAGGFHADVSFNFDNVSAVDTVTGAKIQLQQNGQGLIPTGPFGFKLNFPAGGAAEFTQNITLGVEAQGSGST